MKPAVTFILGLLAAGLSSAATEKKLPDHVRSAFENATLVVFADVRQEQTKVTVEPIEVWKSEPGYKVVTAVIPRKGGPNWQSNATKALVCFFLKEGVSSHQMFFVKADRLILAPDLSLSEVRAVLDPAWQTFFEMSQKIPDGTSRKKG